MTRSSRLCDRRSFLGTLAAGIAAACGYKSAPAAPVLQGLTFHKDAFAFVMADMPMRYDVLYGFAAFRPDYAVRVLDESSTCLQWHERNFDPARLPL